MKRRGFTLVELLIVILVISILASIIVAGIVAALNAAKETQAQQLITQIENAAILYARDFGDLPPTQAGEPYESGSLANALSKLGPKKQPYMYFEEPDVMAWPMSDSSHIRNPANPKTSIHVRRGKRELEIWAEDCDGDPIGIRNWK
jgi:prepilin-type N-terminal cleavage/methylation domain-containing protein